MKYTAPKLFVSAAAGDESQGAMSATAPEEKPYTYAVYIAAEQREDLVHDLEEAMDDLTNCECDITPLYTRAQAQPQEQEGQPALSDEQIVALVSPHLWFNDGPDGDNSTDDVLKAVRAILAAGSQAVQVPGWRPIETAPKNGATIWAFNGEQGRMTWTEGDGWSLWVWEDELLSDVDPSPDQPTQWQPLPPPPLQPLAGGEVQG